MTTDGYLSYLRYRWPAKHQQYLAQMEQINNDRTSGTRFIQSLACQQKWAEHAKTLMTLAAAGKAVGCGKS